MKVRNARETWMAVFQQTTSPALTMFSSSPEPPLMPRGTKSLVPALGESQRWSTLVACGRLMVMPSQ